MIQETTMKLNVDELGSRTEKKSQMPLFNMAKQSFIVESENYN